MFASVKMSGKLLQCATGAMPRVCKVQHWHYGNHCRRARLWCWGHNVRRKTTHRSGPQETMRLTLLMASTAVAASLLGTLWVVRQGARRARWLDQGYQAGPQKFHAMPVPRVGGVGVYAGLWAAAGIGWWAGWAATPARCSCCMQVSGGLAAGAGAWAVWGAVPMDACRQMWPLGRQMACACMVFDRSCQTTQRVTDCPAWHGCLWLAHVSSRSQT